MTLRVSSLFRVPALALSPTNALHLILDRKVALLFRRLDKTNQLCLRLCSNVNGQLTVFFFASAFCRHLCVLLPFDISDIQVCLSVIPEYAKASPRVDKRCRY